MASAVSRYVDKDIQPAKSVLNPRALSDSELQLKILAAWASKTVDEECARPTTTVYLQRRRCCVDAGDHTRATGVRPKTKQDGHRPITDARTMRITTVGINARTVAIRTACVRPRAIKIGRSAGDEGRNELVRNTSAVLLRYRKPDNVR